MSCSSGHREKLALNSRHAHVWFFLRLTLALASPSDDERGDVANADTTWTERAADELSDERKSSLRRAQIIFNQCQTGPQ